MSEGSGIMFENDNPHVVLGVLKNIFRKMVEPLLTYKVCEEFKKYQSILLFLQIISKSNGYKRIKVSIH